MQKVSGRQGGLLGFLTGRRPVKAKPQAPATRPVPKPDRRRATQRVPMRYAAPAKHPDAVYLTARSPAPVYTEELFAEFPPEKGDNIPPPALADLKSELLGLSMTDPSPSPEWLQKFGYRCYEHYAITTCYLYY